MSVRHSVPRVHTPPKLHLDTARLINIAKLRRGANVPQRFREAYEPARNLFSWSVYADSSRTFHGDGILRFIIGDRRKGWVAAFELCGIIGNGLKPRPDGLAFGGAHHRPGIEQHLSMERWQD